LEKEFLTFKTCSLSAQFSDSHSALYLPNLSQAVAGKRPARRIRIWYRHPA